MQTSPKTLSSSSASRFLGRQGREYAASKELADVDRALKSDMEEVADTNNITGQELYRSI
jgi:hypothetical protein